MAFVDASRQVMKGAAEGEEEAMREVSVNWALQYGNCQPRP